MGYWETLEVSFAGDEVNTLINLKSWRGRMQIKKKRR